MTDDPDNKTFQEMQAELEALTAKVAAMSSDPDIPADDPKWGDPIVMGAVAGNEVSVQPPLNKAAMKRMTPAAFVGLALHARLVTIERFVQQLVRLEAKRQAAESPQVAQVKEPADQGAKTAAKKKTTKKRTSKKTAAKKKTTKKK